MGALNNRIFGFVLILAAAALLVSLADGVQNERHIQSIYKRSAGEFLLPRVNSPHKLHDYHVEPPHLQQLRVARRSEDPLHREMILPENARRIRRSPQLFPKLQGGINAGGINAGANLNTGTGRVRGPGGDIGDAIEFERKKSTAGLTTPKPKIKAGIGSIGNLGLGSLGGQLRADLESVGSELKGDLSKIGNEVKTQAAKIGGEVADIGSIDGDLELAKVNDEVKAEIGKIEGDVKSELDKIGNEIKVGNVSSVLVPEIEKIGAEVKTELGQVNGLKAGIGNISSEVTAELGKIADEIKTEAENNRNGVKAGLGSIADMVNAGLDGISQKVKTGIGSAGSEVIAELGNLGSEVNPELPNISELELGDLEFGLRMLDIEPKVDLRKIADKVKEPVDNTSRERKADLGFDLPKVELGLTAGNLNGNGDTGGVGGGIGLGNIGGDIELKVPEPKLNPDQVGLNVRAPKIIANVGRPDTKLELNIPKTEVSTGLEKIGDDFVFKNPVLKLDASLGNSSGEIGFKVPNTQINADLGNVGGNIGLNVPKPEINANLGGLGGEVKLDIPKPEISANLGNVGGKVDLGIPKANLGADLGLGGVGGELDLNLPKPEINANLGNLGGKVELGIPKANVSAGLGLGSVGGELDLNLAKPEIKADLNIPKPVLNTSLGNLGAEVNLNLPKAELGADLGKLTEDINLRVVNVPKIQVTTTSTTSKPTPSTTPTTAPTTQSTTTAATTTQSARDDKSSTTSTTEAAPAETEDKSTSTTESTPDYVGDEAVAEGQDSESEKPETTTEEPESVTDLQPNAEPLTVMEYNVKDGELLLPGDYNILEAPKENIGSFVFVKILGIQEIDEIKEKLSFDMDFTVQWVDTKILAASVVDNDNSSADSNDTSVRRRRDAEGAMNTDLETLDPEFINHIWRPDIFMEDLVKVEYPTILGKPVVAFKLNKRTGFFSYTVRMTVTVNCPMSFVYYPADTQRCELRVASYSHPNDELKIDWLQVDAGLFGVQIDDPNHHNFDLKVDNIEKLELMPTLNNPDRASYDVLRFTIAGRRKLSYHLTQTYLPSVLHIFVTWLVFLIPYTLYDSRIGTTMTTLLTMTALFSGVRETAPAVSYMKAIDLWMVVCVIFVFLNLVELTVMTWLRTALEAYYKQVEEEDARNENGDKAHEVYMYRGGNGKSMRDPEKRTPITIKTIRWFEKLEKYFKFFEKYSFRLFIIMFILFNIIYWIWLLSCSKYFKWDNRSQSEL